jgi:bifunctional ADP-heptose synthase (sugar kinase/adenylyltransferase)
LDTRSKIISYQQARQRFQDQPCQWVTGHFDPLLAEHVTRLRQNLTPGRLLVVEVTNPAQPLLPQRARAELVAALAMVDYVVLRNDDSTPAAEEDSSITERFIKRVQRRHRGNGKA